MDSLISIIVPIYNAEKYLSICIESILYQTYKNLQVILVNDGSTDNSLNICNWYKTLDNRICVIDKPNEGVSSTRNMGIRLAKGEYIGFVDSDDYVETNMYEILLNRIKNDKSQICAMTSYTIKNVKKYDGMNKNKTISANNALKYLLLLKFPTSMWAYLYSKDIIKNCTLNNEIHFFEDFEFNFNILSMVSKVSLCDKCLYNYRINENSTNMQQINDKRITCLNIYELIIRRLENNNKVLVKYAMYFRTHCLISVILSISKSIEPDDKYYRIVRKNAKDMIWKTIFSRVVPITYKVLILICSVNPYLLCKILYLMRRKKKL